MNNDRDSNKRFAFLDPDEVESPIWVISDFCSHDFLHSWREEIYELFTIAMGSPDWQGDAPIDKANRLFSLKMLITLLEAVYLLNQMHESGQLAIKDPDNKTEPSDKKE